MDRNLIYNTRNSILCDNLHGKRNWKTIYIYTHIHTHIHTRSGADCGSDHQLLIAKFRLKLKKVGKPLGHSGTT